MPSTCTLLLTLSRTPCESAMATAGSLLAACAGQPAVLVAHGDREAQEEAVREFADQHPSLDLLMHTRRESTDGALAAGVAMAKTDWIAWIDLDRTALTAADLPAMRSAIVACADAGPDGFLQAQGLLLFPREAFGKLGNVPWKSRVMPELLEQSGLRERSPHASSAWTHWLHRLYARFASRFARRGHSWSRARV